MNKKGLIICLIWGLITQFNTLASANSTPIITGGTPQYKAVF
jgi:hypothetical protein